MDNGDVRITDPQIEESGSGASVIQGEPSLLRGEKLVKVYAAAQSAD